MVFTSTPVFAQSAIAPDNTLGAENSKVVNNFNSLPVEVITGGATRGVNLFHSFREFNVSEGRGAYFVSPSTDIQNILARVTGSNRSEILGRLGTLQVINGNIASSKANLFLINPNGIIFGQNASLDVQGSFLGTTASGVQFGSQGSFSATNPQAVPLLTINPSALFFNQINRNEIINRSRQIEIPGSFYLIGGNITFDGGVASSQGNRLELGAVAGTGTVELIGSGNQMQLAFPEGLPKADIVLQNNAFALTTGGGAISVNAGNLSLSGNSFISVILAASEGTPGVAAGDVVVNATGNVALDSLSGILSSGLENSFGNTGNVAINAQSIRLTNQSQIGSNGARSQGNIVLNVKDNVSLSNSFINTYGILNSIGKSGDITIAARNINLSNQSNINSANIGQGQGGKITLKAQEAISLESDSNIFSGSNASVFGQVNNQPSGDIEIKTRTLSLDGSQTSINSSNLDEGRGGDIRILADDSISLNGSAISSTSGQISLNGSTISPTSGKGNSGNIHLETRSLTLANGGNIGTQSSGSGKSGDLLVNASDSVSLSGIATLINPQTGETTITESRLSTSAFGAGNSGQLTINTQRLRVNDSGDITTSTEFGRGGDLTINAKDSVEIVGGSPNGSSIISTGTFGSGDAGNMSISTGHLSIRDGALVSTFTLGKGKGGNLTIDAKDFIEVVGGSPNNRTILSTNTFGSGDAGSLNISAGRLSIRDGAVVSTSTFSTGKAGNLTVHADRSVELIGTSADGRFFSSLVTAAQSGSTGDAGDLKITTQNLLVRDGAQVSTGTFGAGKGGNLTINTSKVQLIGTSSDGRFVSGLGSSTGQGLTGNAGSLTITTQDLLVRDGAQVTAGTSSVGKGGNLTVNASGNVEVIGASANGLLNSRLSTSADQGLTGNAGDLTINAQNLLVRDGGIVDAVTSGQGKGGNLTVNATGKVELIGTLPDGSLPTIFSTSAQLGSTGDAGDLTINAQDLFVRQGAQISASTFSTSKAGNLTVNASRKVELVGGSTDGRFISGLGASANQGSTGDAGSITIKTQDLLVQDGARVFTATVGAGKAGNLIVNALNKVELIGTSVVGLPGGLIASAASGSTGDAGNLTVNTPNLLARDGAQVLASTFSSGRGGNLTVNASKSVQLIGQSVNSDFLSGLFASSEKGATGNAGNLTVNTPNLLARDGAQVIAATFTSGKGGNLTVNASENVQLIGKSANEFPSGLFTSAELGSTGDAGDLRVNTHNLLVSNNAGVFVYSRGTGNAGIMTINADIIRLDNQASLNANTRSPNKDPNKEQATINLNSQNLILRRNSNITTNATGKDVIGGNINIKTNFLAAFENSDISANSTDFRGGNVTINAKGIFGIQFRDVASPQTNDITATGVSRELGGNVEITTPDIDPTSGLVELPINLDDASRQISTACTPGTRQFQNTFVATGRGGLPINPTEPLQDSSTVSTWVRLRPRPENLAKTTISPQPTAASNTTTVAAATDQIVPATGWVVDTNGNIKLVAQDMSVTTRSPWQTSASCPVSQ